jgi:hypothetical protein
VCLKIAPIKLVGKGGWPSEHIPLGSVERLRIGMKYDEWLYVAFSLACTAIVLGWLLFLIFAEWSSSQPIIVLATPPLLACTRSSR